jgi:hypothetical protein
LVAFLLGVLVHVGLLALAYFGGALKPLSTLLWLVLALPGAIVDMTAEVLPPSPLTAGVLVVVASLVNGLAYAGVVALVARLTARKPTS